MHCSIATVGVKTCKRVYITYIGNIENKLTMPLTIVHISDVCDVYYNVCLSELI